MLSLEITYQSSKDLLDQDLRSLYLSAGWTSYTDDFDDLSRLITQSELVISAWDGDLLIGLIRTVGDGLSIRYIQDILVLPNYQKQGIGTKLLLHVLKKSTHIRQCLLITDGQKDNQPIIDWYKKQHMTEFKDLDLVGLYHNKKEITDSL